MKFSEFVKKCRTGYPASIPMIVAHIQKYLMENPIIEEETVDNKIEDAIDTALEGVVEETTEEVLEYIEENPEIVPLQPMQGATSESDGVAGIVPKPLAGDNNKALFGDGTYKTIDSVSVMQGATALADGESGLVPKPVAGDNEKVLYGDGTFKTIPQITIDSSLSTSSENPVQNKVIATAINNIPVITVDSALSTSSENPVQNKVIATAINSIPVITVDSALSTSSENPVQNKVIATAINSIPVITVDSALSTSSENPVQNKVIATAIADIVSLIPVSLTITSADWVNDSDWPLIINNVPIPPIGESAAKCSLATISNANCADGDDFKLSDYSKSLLQNSLWIYIGQGTIYVATKNNGAPTATVVIDGVVLHK